MIRITDFAQAKSGTTRSQVQHGLGHWGPGISYPGLAWFILMLLSPENQSLPDDVRDLASRSIPKDLADDRHDQDWEDSLRLAGSAFFGAATYAEETIVAYLGGVVDGATLHLDLLVDLNSEDPASVASALLGELSIPIRQYAADNPALKSVSIWAKPSAPWHETFAHNNDLVAERSLHQMRAGLPIDTEVAPSRPFVPGTDNEALRQVNNRAFGDHPDQGHQSQTEFDAGLNQPWVRPEGIRIVEKDGRIAGFCWTKIHQSPRLGEIYVIGVDPDFHGMGLGKPTTAAGLEWLAHQELSTAMLYVEADNDPALATYNRLGFSTVRTDRSWNWLLLPKSKAT